jgi:acetyl-CoA C-acetyltransferase
MKVERSIEIAAPPEKVYDLIADPERLGEWVTIHQYVDGKAPDELVKGAKMAQCLRLAGRNFKVKWTVVESDRPHRLVWEGKGPMRSKAKVVNEIEPNGTGTRFSYLNEYSLPGGPLGNMAGPMVRRVTGKEVDATLQKLKELLE